MRFVWLRAIPILLFTVVACSTPATIEIPVPTSEATPLLLVNPQSGTSEQATAGSAPSNLVPRITVQELAKKIENRATIIIVDARPKEEYDVDHINGAISVPMATVLAGEWSPPPDKEIIFY